MLKGRRVAVTGASGFIATRTIEYLSLATACEVRACVRSFSKLGRLAELPQERLSFHRADVLDPAGVRAAFEGCDTVIHCAYGSDGSEEERWRTTVDGTRIVVETAQASGATRLVHLSTAAIHDTAGREVLDEETPKLAAAETGSYEEAKLAAEDVVRASDLDAVALRPTVVYGPWGKDWTTVAISRLRAGVGLPSGSESGVCNSVYVDDVARAIVLACGAQGREPLLIASDEPVTWAQFYDAFRALLPSPASSGESVIEDWERALYADRARADIARARRVLGYRPRVSFARGMARVGAWAAWFGLLDSGGDRR